MSDSIYEIAGEMAEFLRESNPHAYPLAKYDVWVHEQREARERAKANRCKHCGQSRAVPPEVGGCDCEESTTLPGMP